MIDRFLNDLGVEKASDCALLACEGDNCFAIVSVDVGLHTFVALNYADDAPVELANETFTSLQDAVKRSIKFLRDEYELIA